MMKLVAASSVTFVHLFIYFRIVINQKRDFVAFLCYV